jgi:hypothetical protein
VGLYVGLYRLIPRGRFLKQNHVSELPEAIPFAKNEKYVSLAKAPQLWQGWASFILRTVLRIGLPYFSWCNIPKRGKYTK